AFARATPWLITAASLSPRLRDEAQRREILVTGADEWSALVALIRNQPSPSHRSLAMAAPHVEGDATGGADLMDEPVVLGPRESRRLADLFDRQARAGLAEDEQRELE